MLSRAKCRIGFENFFENGQQFDLFILAHRLDRGGAFFKVVGPQGDGILCVVDFFPLAASKFDLLEIAGGNHDGLAILDQRLERERIEQCSPLAVFIGGSLLADRRLAVPKIEFSLVVGGKDRG
jgi:hypothetical protein